MPKPSQDSFSDSRTAVPAPKPLIDANHAASKRKGRTVELAVDGDHARDVADWGRTGQHSPVDLSASDDDGEPGGGGASMSSGLSARDAQWGADGRGGPRSRPFGPAEGLASLVHHTKTYMASQALRKCAPITGCHHDFINSAPGLSSRLCVNPNACILGRVLTSSSRL